MPISPIEPVVIPTINLPPPVTRGMPVPPTRGIQVPRMQEPNIQFPIMELPTTVPSEMDSGNGQSQGADQGAEDNRNMLPDPNTIFELPPDPISTIPIPFSDFEIPTPDSQVLSTTASAAFIATSTALAATTALKPVLDSLFKILKVVFKQAMNKILKKKVVDYTKIKNQELSLESLDRFRFDSSRPYLGPQYPGKAQRKVKKDVEKPQTE
jgi:hypothetical protein